MRRLAGVTQSPRNEQAATIDDSKTQKSLFSVGLTLIVDSQNEPVEERAKIRKVNAMIS